MQQPKDEVRSVWYRLGPTLVVGVVIGTVVGSMVGDWWAGIIVGGLAAFFIWDMPV